MHIRRWVGFGLGAAVLAIVALAIAVPRTVGSYGLGCGSATLRLRGRLVEKASGEPIAGAWLLTLPNRAWADEPETIANYRKWNAEKAEAVAKMRGEGRETPPFRRASLCASGTTDSNGAFEVLVDVPFSVRTVDGVPLDPSAPPSRHGVRALRVELTGREPIVMDVAGGTWNEEKGDPLGIWATWDLGTLRVSGKK